MARLDSLKRAIEPFPDGIQMNPHPLSSGSVDLPILYRDCTTFGAIYLADVAATTRLLPSKDFKPVCRKDRALVVISAFEYRDTTIGRYNEFAVILPILFKPFLPGPIPNLLLAKTPWGRLGGYICHLPVTTRIALDAGKEVWGFPKILADIQIRERALSIDCDLKTHKGEFILRLSATRGSGIDIPFTNIPLFSVKENRVLQTTISTKGSFKRIPVARIGLKYGNHSMASQLKSLSMSESPIMAFHSENLRSRLPAPGRTFPV